MEKITVNNEVVRVFFSVLEKYTITKTFEVDFKDIKKDMDELKKYVLWMLHEFYFALQALSSFELEFNEKDLIEAWSKFTKTNFQSP